MKILSPLDLTGVGILNLKDPSANSDGANKGYVDGQVKKGSAGYAQQRTRNTSVGPSVPDGRTFVDVDNTLDLTVKAATGDILEVSIQSMVQQQPPALYLNAYTVVGGSRVNRIEPAVSAPSGWSAPANLLAYLAGSYQYAVKAADVSSGTVQLRLVANITSTGYPAARTLYSVLFAAKNLG